MMLGSVLMMLKNGDKIYYEDKEYLILYVYNSGYLEIQDIHNPYIVKLVNRVDVMLERYSLV
jgi:hypothetical protein